jgi:TetR/AcrR family transcriptional regulator, regulator of autoinduction and epiphytic fitness
MSKTKQNLERSKSAEKSAAILKGAMEEFLKHGYAGSSMDKVAKASGVSKATVYSHFGDKESLFNAVIHDLAEERLKASIDVQQPQFSGQSPQEVLSAIATKMIANATQDSIVQDFMRIIIGESGRFPELAKAYVNNLARPTIETLTQYLKLHPELAIKDPEATVRIMMGSLVYFIMLQEMMHGKDIMPLESDRLINTLVDLIVRSS